MRAADAWERTLAQARAESIRLAFPKGCRVRLSTMGRLVAHHRRESRVGTVTGYCRDAEALRVMWEGFKAVQEWHRDFVERVGPNA